MIIPIHDAYVKTYVIDITLLLLSILEHLETLGNSIHKQNDENCK